MPDRREIDLNAWHLDKRVPIATIGALLFQAAITLWWAATTTSRIEQVERRASILEIHDEADRVGQNKIASDLGEIKAQLAILLSRMQQGK